MATDAHSVIAMELRPMDVADDIVNLAFGLTLGAIAEAVALMFGLGGREAAGRQMEYWFSQLRRGDADRLPGAREAIGSHAESPSPPLR
jgi:hypothetical protein